MPDHTLAETTNPLNGVTEKLCKLVDKIESLSKETRFNLSNLNNHEPLILVLGGPCEECRYAIHHNVVNRRGDTRTLSIAGCLFAPQRSNLSTFPFTNARCFTPRGESKPCLIS